MNDFTPVRSLVGGVLIGIAASVLYVGSGRVAGISGIIGGLFSRTPGERGWRLQFLAGLALGGLILRAVYPPAFAVTGRSLAAVGVAGLLVGFGSRLGGGCTSGHGVCGISRLSVRSIIATATFMTTGVLTVLVTGRWLGMAW